MRPFPIHRRRIYEEVVSRLEEMILDGDYAPGDYLPPERELMELFGVGRPAIREALFALQKMGLVSVTTGERPRVTEPRADVLVGELGGAARHFLARPEGMRHFQQARRLFEAALARAAAETATDEDVGALRAALDENAAALGDPKSFEESDVRFHYVLATIPSNPIFTAVHSGIVDWLREQRTTSLKAQGADHAALAAHQRIFAAVAARDPEAAERAMREHLDEVADYYWRVEGG